MPGTQYTLRVFVTIVIIIIYSAVRLQPPDGSQPTASTAGLRQASPTPGSQPACTAAVGLDFSVLRAPEPLKGPCTLQGGGRGAPSGTPGRAVSCGRGVEAVPAHPGRASSTPWGQDALADSHTRAAPPGTEPGAQWPLAGAGQLGARMPCIIAHLSELKAGAVRAPGQDPNPPPPPPLSNPAQGPSPAPRGPSASQALTAPAPRASRVGPQARPVVRSAPRAAADLRLPATRAAHEASAAAGSWSRASPSPRARRGDGDSPPRRPPLRASNSATRFKPKPAFPAPRLIGRRPRDAITSDVAAARGRWAPGLRAAPLRGGGVAARRRGNARAVSGGADPANAIVTCVVLVLGLQGVKVAPVTGVCGGLSRQPRRGPLPGLRTPGGDAGRASGAGVRLHWPLGTWPPRPPWPPGPAGGHTGVPAPRSRPPLSPAGRQEPRVWGAGVSGGGRGGEPRPAQPAALEQAACTPSARTGAAAAGLLARGGGAAPRAPRLRARPRSGTKGRRSRGAAADPPPGAVRPRAGPPGPASTCGRGPQLPPRQPAPRRRHARGSAPPPPAPGPHLGAPPTPSCRLSLGLSGIRDRVGPGRSSPPPLVGELPSQRPARGCERAARGPRVAATLLGLEPGTRWSK
ncbi:collagen alpha-1(I) chain-like [Canis lupus familiaris]|uniref:collagen alpha-1(I) chain-like n=1 Tax=Canis lupus familiaris TaxID=9615 RepID=UPI0018F4665A|nr:collagen alpha-1(I) chain-like [Canis lupus familiaris]